MFDESVIFLESETISLYLALNLTPTAHMLSHEWSLPGTMLEALSQLCCALVSITIDNVLIWQAQTQVSFGLFAGLFLHKITGTTVCEGGRTSPDGNHVPQSAMGRFTWCLYKALT